MDPWWNHPRRAVRRVAGHYCANVKMDALEMGELVDALGGFLVGACRRGRLGTVESERLVCAHPLFVPTQLVFHPAEFASSNTGRAEEVFDKLVRCANREDADEGGFPAAATFDDFSKACLTVIW